MDFHDYLLLVAARLKQADHGEYLRLVILLRDTANDTIQKIETQRVETDAPDRETKA